MIVKQRIMKEQENNALLKNLGTETTLIKIPLVGPLLFQMN